MAGNKLTPPTGGNIHPIRPDLQISDKAPIFGGGDGGGGMDDRIVALEKRLDRFDGKVDSMLERTAKIEGKIEDMPTKDWMNTRLLAMFGALGVMMAVFVTLARIIP